MAETKQSRSWTIVNKNTGAEIVQFTSIIDFAASHPSDAVEETIENGSFISYNKTSGPVTIDTTLGYAGALEDRQTTLNKLELLRSSLDTFSFVTPEMEYKNMTLCGFEQPQRTNAYAANILILSLHMKEVRYATSQYYDGDLPSYQVQNQEDMTAARSGTVQVNSAGGTDTASGSALADWAGVEDTRETIPPSATSTGAQLSAADVGGYEWTDAQKKEIADKWKNGNPNYDPNSYDDRFFILNDNQVLDCETLEVINTPGASADN